jgi:hypothetical protein
MLRIPDPATGPSRLVVVLNWIEEVKRILEAG